MTRKLHFWASALLLVTVVAFAALFTGCEDEPGLANVDNLFAQNDTENQEREDGLIPLTISPLEGSITYVGERIAIRAKGALLPVRWSPANRAAATVNVVGSRTDYAVFQSKLLLPNTVLAVDAAGRTATMNITVGAGVDGLTITPSEASITNIPALTVEFSVAGGAAPYAWSTVFPILGTMNGTTYEPELGGSYLAGTNLVTVTDSAGDVATATVVHQ